MLSLETRETALPIASEAVYETLQSSTLRNAFAPNDLTILASVARFALARRGDAIWLSGDQVDFFGLVKAGFAKMVRGSMSGTDATLELFGPGQIFGMLGTIQGCGCPLSAIAVTDVVYLRVPKRVFLPLYSRNEQFKDHLIRRSSLRLHAAFDLMAQLFGGKVERRLAAMLFILAESYSVELEGALRLDVPLTRQDLAEMTGTTVESAIRTLSRWQQDGLIETDRHYITLLEPEKLRAVLAS